MPSWSSLCVMPLKARPQHGILVDSHLATPMAEVAGLSVSHNSIFVVLTFGLHICRHAKARSWL
eukprot:COSAG02_NODE_3905_length_6058_cov_5.265481_7_plen_64_part_00